MRIVGGTERLECEVTLAKPELGFDEVLDSRIMVLYQICNHSYFSSRPVTKSITIKVCKTIISPVVLCGCESWSLILKEEHGLRAFKKRVLTQEL